MFLIKGHTTFNFSPQFFIWRITGNTWCIFYPCHQIYVFNDTLKFSPHFLKFYLCFLKCNVIFSSRISPKEIPSFLLFFVALLIFAVLTRSPSDQAEIWHIFPIGQAHNPLNWALNPAGRGLVCGKSKKHPSSKS